MKKYSENVKSITRTIETLNYFKKEFRELVTFPESTTERDVFHNLYEIVDCIILALQDIKLGRYTYKPAMIKVHKRLKELIQSPEYGNWSAWRELLEFNFKGLTVSKKTRHHILVMSEILEEITK